MNYKSNLKEFKEWTICKEIIYRLFLSIFATLVLGVVLINVLNLRLDEVLSDSMYPVFTDQDVIVVKPQDSYKKGDVIEFVRDNALVTHRIIAYDEGTKTFTAKGDNASGEQSVTLNEIKGKQVLVWKNGRWVYHTIKDNYFLLLTIVIGCWVLTSTLQNEIEIKRHNIMKV